MRCTKRRPHEQAVLHCQQPSCRVHSCCRECTLQRKIWEETCKPPSEHRLSSSRRPGHHHVMTTCSRHFERPLRQWLTSDISKIRYVLPNAAGMLLHRTPGSVPGKDLQKLSQRLDSKHAMPPDDASVSTGF